MPKIILHNLYAVLLILIATLTGSCSEKQDAQGELKGESPYPNIVLIYADDMGYGDCGFLGATNIQTPELDQLARTGVYFTQGYVSASVCGPSRAGLMTGRYQQRFGAEFIPDPNTREALSFNDKNRNQPFFLYMPCNAVHTPLKAPEKYLEEFEHTEHPKRKLLAAMNYALDLSIGRVLSSIKENGLQENTLIFFLSDNGGKPKGNFSYNLPLRGEKGQHFEGGVHVPFLMKWKNHIPENITYNKPVSSLDIFPTIMAAIGYQVQDEWRLEGVNLLPHVLGNDRSASHETLFWRKGKKLTMRTLDWKFVKDGEKVELFNISKDPYETTDLATSHPEKLQELMKSYDEWNAKNIPAQFGHDPKEFPVEVIRTRRTELPS